MDITDEELDAFTSAIMVRHGIDFTCYEKKSLKRRVHRALSIFKLGSIHELWLKILHDNNFVHLFVNELSVGLTAMFRDPDFWSKLKTILPEFIKKRGKANVWHAGCSSGEEVFTFNIILRELGLENNATTLATDINSAALTQAQSGIYHSILLKDYCHNYSKYNQYGKLERYFINDHKCGIMDKSLITNVRFEKSNLITDNHNEKFDIIFCRNVMIYFDLFAKKKVVEKFHNNLKPDGLLIIGFYDTLTSVIDKLKFETFDLKNKIFIKNAQLTAETK